MSKKKDHESNRPGVIMIELTGSGTRRQPSMGDAGRMYDKSEFKIIKVIHSPTKWSITDSLMLYPDPGKDSIGKIIYVKPERDRNWRLTVD